MLTITVHNSQGASDAVKRATRSQIDAWLSTWSDPQNLSAVVRDDEGAKIAVKPFGQKTIKWANHPNRSKSK